MITLLIKKISQKIEGKDHITHVLQIGMLLLNLTKLKKIKRFYQAQVKSQNRISADICSSIDLLSAKCKFLMLVSK
jgi:hypothetical protein